MANLESLGKVIETDVLVIGGGPSGLWAANRAREFVERVTIVDKGPRDWGGLASRASGGFVAVLPGENVDDFVKDVVRFYMGICQQDLVEKILEQAIYRLEDYQRLGLEFFTNPDGTLSSIPQAELDHIKLYVPKPFPRGGQRMAELLVDEAKRLGVRRLGRIQVTDLLKHDGSIAGAVGFHTLSGEFYIFRSKAVILTTGCGAWKHHSNDHTSTGEGIAMALRAGVELSNLEFGSAVIYPKLFAWEGSAHLTALGAKFVNAKGETFGTSSDGKATISCGTPVFDNMISELNKNKIPFYLDCTSIKPEDRDLVMPTDGWMELNYQKLLSLGIDVLAQKTEWIVTLRQLQGGIVADVEGRTSVPGLFAAGRARTVEPGARLWGWSMCLTAVTGHLAGEVATKYALSHKDLPIDEYEVKMLKNNLYAPLSKAGIPPKELLRSIQETVFPAEVCMVKSEKNLREALAQIENIRDELLPQMGAEDPHYLLKLIEVRSITLMTELFLRASLMRTESRAGHFREDYPERDDRNWLKWVIISRRGEKLNLRTKPIPFDQYKFKYPFPDR